MFHSPRSCLMSLCGLVEPAALIGAALIAGSPVVRGIAVGIVALQMAAIEAAPASMAAIEAAPASACAADTSRTPRPSATAPASASSTLPQWILDGDIVLGLSLLSSRLGVPDFGSVRGLVGLLVLCSGCLVCGYV